MFVDKVSISLRAGNGGDGALSFRHEKFRARGGPDGGDGGRGGDVVFMASRNENTLANFRYKKLLKAQDGQPGFKSKKHGKNGESLVVKVPVGTIVLKNDEVLADLSSDESQAVIATGGAGGFGNAHFVSSTRQAPRISEKGEKGEELEAVLELKMIADVGIIGLPNAGKSTLLSVVSNAKPEIADYPFTTLHPNLGVVDIDSSHSLLFADIPGLIEGASQGKGLGDEFLRHVERTSVLVHLIDAYNPDAGQAYKTINKELKDYSLEISKRPQVVALTKTEGMASAELSKIYKKLRTALPKNTPFMAISSANRQGIDELLRTVSKITKAEKKKIAAKDLKSRLPVIGVKSSEDSWHVGKTRKGFVVTGAKIERFAMRTRFEDFHGQQRFRDIMDKMGIIAELEKQGLEPGQTIQIGLPAVAKLEY